jgi:alkanesulfonate monooxygenase SsuD/methylene tetrahydromethanopterin reductase-like flavin-dependent oxidoreductase (luciferase family)
VRRWVAEAQAAAAGREVRVPSAEELYEQGVCVGSPDEVLRTVRRYEEVGFDQLVFSAHSGYEERAEDAGRSLRLMGERVLPALRAGRR